MIELYAALILHEAKKEINEENIKKILNSVEISVDEAKIKVLLDALKGVNIDEAIKQATTLQLASTETAQPKEEKKEKEEKKAEEEAVAGLSALFG